MGPLDMGRIRAPPSSFEGGGIQEAIVEGNKSFANTVGDLAKVAGP